MTGGTTTWEAVLKGHSIIVLKEVVFYSLRISSHHQDRKDFLKLKYDVALLGLIYTELQLLIKSHHNKSAKFGKRSLKYI